MDFDYSNSFGNQYPLMGGANASFEKPQNSVQIGYSQPSQVNPTSLVFGQQAAAAADPFAQQRGQYQQQLSALMGGIGTNQTQQDINQALTMAQGAGAANNPYMQMLNSLMTNPSSITSTPGAQYAMQQATNATQRQMAAQGLGNSGNILAEISKQTQGIAEQDYNQQVQNLMQSAGLFNATQQQQFGELSGVAGLQQGQQNSILGNLATFSGANQGSPATAGGFLSNLMGSSGGASGTHSGSSGGSMRGTSGGSPNQFNDEYSKLVLSGVDPIVAGRDVSRAQVAEAADPAYQIYGTQVGLIDNTAGVRP